jgi:hypothetical protein
MHRKQSEIEEGVDISAQQQTIRHMVCFGTTVRNDMSRFQSLDDVTASQTPPAKPVA